MRAVLPSRSLVALIALFGATALSAASLPPLRTMYDLQGAAIYADLCIDRATSDINGLRIFVRSAKSKPRVLAQVAEGGLGELLPASSRERHRALLFTIAADPGYQATEAIIGRVHRRYIALKSAATGGKFYRLFRRNGTSEAPVCQ